MDEKLEHILQQVKLLCEQNPEFKEELVKAFQLGIPKIETKVEMSGDGFASAMRLQHERCRKKARYYYRDIKDAALRKDLVNDYAQMLWYKSIFEVGKYFVHVNYQVENMLNYYLAHTDFHKKVENNPKMYLRTLNITSGYKVDIDVYSYSFNKNDGKPLDVSKIRSLWAKILFWAIDTKELDVLEKNSSNFNAIISIRNEENHANSESKNKAIDYWQNLEDGLAFAFIEAIIKQIRNSVIRLEQ